jgi:hypothetical protein
MDKLTKPQLKKLAGEMLRLERKLHTEGTLTDEEHSRLQRLHSAHGGGLFDSIKEWIFKNIHPLGKMIEHAKKARARHRGGVRGGVLQLNQLGAPINQMFQRLRSMLGRHLQALSPDFGDEITELIMHYVNIYHMGQPLPSSAELRAEIRAIIIRNAVDYIQPSIIPDIVETIEDIIRRTIFQQ